MYSRSASLPCPSSSSSTHPQLRRSESLPADLQRHAFVRSAGTAPLPIDCDALKLSASQQALLPAAFPIAPYPDIESPTTRSPAFSATRHALGRLFDDISREPLTGRNADYIRALADCDPNRFSVSMVTQDGGQLSFGDADTTFTIQSISKPLDHLMALRERGADAVARHIGKLPSGFPFNAPVTEGIARTVTPTYRATTRLMDLKNINRASHMASRLGWYGSRRPVNASCNLGALTATLLGIRESNPPCHDAAPGRSADDYLERSIELFTRMASRTSGCSLSFGEADTQRATSEKAHVVCVDPLVMVSEINDSASNQALARAMIVGSSTSALHDPAVPIRAFHTTRAYTGNCALSTHSAAAAVFAATLANDGENPFTGDRVISSDHAALTLEQMRVGGLYEATEAFTERTGFVCKSGVGGCIIAIDPLTHIAIATHSSPLDPQGNSARGMAYLERLAASGAYRAFRARCMASMTTP